MKTHYSSTLNSNPFLLQHRSLILFVSLLFMNLVSIAQTQPAIQTLPVSQNFGTASFATMPAGFAGWAANGATLSTQSVAEASAPTQNASMAAATATSTTGKVYGYANTGSNNGRVYIQTSGNATDGADQMVTAINTTGKVSITVTYKLEMLVALTRTIGVVMQYRIGHSGTWTTVTGTNNPYSHNTTSLDVVNASVTLPAAADNQAEVQIRWATWRGTEAGSSSGIAIDDININGSTAPPTITVSTTSLPSFGNVAVGSTSAEQFYTVRGQNLTDPLIVTAPTDYEVSLTSGSGFTSSFSVTPTLGEVSTQTVFVHYKPTAPGASSTSINHTSTGASPKTVSVSGNGTSCSPPTITASGPVTFCSGGSVTLTCTAGASYHWSTTATTQSIVVSSGGSYSVTMTDGSGCTATSNTTLVTVNNFGVTGTVFSENAGSPAVTTLVNAYTGWQNNGTYFYSSSSSPQADVRITTPSTGYVGASAGGNIFFGFSSTGSSIRDFTMSGINSLHYTGLTLSFGLLRSDLTSGLTVEVSSDGIGWASLTFTQPASANSWTKITASGTIPATANLRIRFSKGNTNTQFRLDDITLSGSVSQLEIVSNTPTTFCNGQSAVLVSNISAGNSWSPNPAFTQAIQVYTANSYYTVVTDANGCTASSNVITTVVNPAPTVFATTTSPTCWMGSDGTATAFGSGGTAPLAYSWNTSPVQTTNAITGLPAGDYTVTVTDATGCTGTGIGAVVDGAQITSTTSATDATCYGMLDGTVSATGTSGVAPYTYEWDLNNKSGLPFSVTVTPKTAAHPYFGVGHPSGYVIDGVEGKELTLVRGITYYFDVNATGFPFMITTSPVGGDTLSIVNTGVTNNKVSVGMLTFTPTASMPSLLYYNCTTQLNVGYRINLINGPTGATLTGLGAGTYNVKVTDAIGCTGVNTATINQPGQIVVTSYLPSASGFVGDNIQVIGSGFTTVTDVKFNGVSSPAFTVDNYFQITAQVPVGATTGQVTVVVGACSAVSSSPFTVVTCPPPTISAGGPTTFCAPGSVTLTSSVNSSYQWSNNETTQSITVSATGSYYVTTTDGAGCTASSSPVVVVVNNYSGYAGPAFSENFGTPTGNPLVNVYTGWQNNGTYSYSSPSANLCDVRTTSPSSGYLGASGSGNIFFGTSTSNPRTFIISGINTENYTGLSLQFGLLRANVAACTTEVMLVDVSSDGISWTPLTYTQPALNIWTLVTASGTIPAVPNLRIRFSKTSCAQFRLDDVKITGTTTQVSIAASGPTNLCAGQSVRLISSIPVGNTWTPNGETTTHANASTSGTYFTTVSDQNGCTAVSNQITVTVNPAISVGITPTHVLCFGNSTGSALAAATGGTPGFTYSWNTAPPQGFNNATGLAAGTYTVTATDAANCSATASTTITQPAAALTLSFTSVNVSCFGGSNGSVNLTVAGGTAPYTYAWSGGQTTEDLSGVSAGLHTVTVTDANNCTATVGVTLTEPAAVTANCSVVSNVSCFGGSNGSANVSATGTGTLSYSWAPSGGTASTATGLVAGTYTVTVTDACGSTTCSVTITEPAVLSLSTTQVDVSCFGGNTGSVNLTVSGGTAGYSYSWSNGPTTEDISGLIAGTYTVSVVDANFCTAGTSVSITEPAAIVISTFSPTTGSAGTPVIISGSGFVGITAVQFNGLSAVFTVDNPNQISATVPAGATTGFITVAAGSCITTSTTQFVVSSGTVTLNLKVYLQGYYDVNTSMMNPVWTNQLRTDLGNGNPGTPTGSECDLVLVSLFDGSNTLAYSDSVMLDINGNGTMTLPSWADGNSYYIFIKHRSHVQTRSAGQVLLSSVTSYDFSTSASQADETGGYGGPMMIEVETGVWALFAGDVTQDGFVGGDDVGAIDNDNLAGLLLDYLANDVTGDGFIGGDDVGIADNNNLVGVFYLYP